MSTEQSLFDLLPAIYKLKDAQIAQGRNQLSPDQTAELAALQILIPPLNSAQQQRLDELTTLAARGPLQSLLMVIDEQIAGMSENLDQFYDDHFIETCAPWVIPYIGDLIGYQSVYGIPASVGSPRAEVAHTISFRRRKGTVLVLEQLARDVTGWGAHAVEFFQVLAWTQYMNHIRLFNHYAPDLRGWKPRVYMNTGFDRTAHTVDVRRIAVERGKYNIQNIGVFLWSLNAYSLTMSPLNSVGGSNEFYRFSLLNRDAPLFNHPVSQGADITAPAEPINVPDVLRRHVLCHDIQSGEDLYYGVGESLVLYIGGKPVPASAIQVCDLAGPDGSWINAPGAGSSYKAAIDPLLGRIALPPPGVTPDQIRATYYYGFNADMGGGEYSRESTFLASVEQVVVRVPGDYTTISAAAAALSGDGVVEVTDSGEYTEPAGFSVTANAGGRIELRAADGCRPTLFLGAPITVSGGLSASIDLNGFVIAYKPAVGGVTPVALVHSLGGAGNQLAILELTHCTIVPGWALNPDGTPQAAWAGLPAVLVESAGTNLVIQRSIVGGLWVSGEASTSAADSIIDSTDVTGVAYVGSIDPATKKPSPGGALTLIGCTTRGKVYTALMTLVSDCICLAALSKADSSGKPPLWESSFWATRKQQGCVRFSYIPEDSITPRTFECVVQGKASPQPVFYSLRYGDPDYCKLFPSTSDAIRRGADDGGEMGAFHFLLAPLRETDLRVRLQEYMPVGLEFGIFYET